MKKLIFKCFLLSLFTCCCFFGIDKVYASELDATFNKKTVGRLPSFDYTLQGGDKIDGKLILTSLPLNGSGRQGGPVKAQFYACSFTSRDYNIVASSSSVFNLVTRRELSDDVKLTFGPICSNSVMFEATGNISLDSSYVSGTIIDFDFAFDVTGSAPFYIYKINYGYSKDFDDYTYNAILDGFSEIIYNQQETNQKLEDLNDSVKDTNDTIKDSDTSEASGEADSFFSGFTTDTHGLTSIITAPLTLIGNITSSTCSPLALEIPFLDGQTLNLPCMSSIYKKYFGSFLDIYQIFTFGIVAYWVCVKIFNLVKDFKNPDHDEVEVMDL